MSDDVSALTPPVYIPNHDTATNIKNHILQSDAWIPEKPTLTEKIKKHKKSYQKVTQDSIQPKENKPLNPLALAAGVSFYSGLTLSSICAWLGVSLLSLTIASGMLVIAGIILAVIAIKKIKANPFQERGHGLAKSVIAIFLFLMFFAVMSALALIQALR